MEAKNITNLTAAAAQVAPVQYNWLAYAGILVVTIPSAVANVLVLATIIATAELRSAPIYIAMAVLAVMDIMHCFIELTAFGGAILVNGYFPSEATSVYFVCLLFPVWYWTCLCYATIVINRWLSICHPEWNAVLFTRRRMLLWIATWPIWFLFMMIPVMMGKCCIVVMVPETWHHVYNIEDHNGEFNYQLIVCSLVSTLPAAMACVFYSLSFWKIKKLKAQISGNADAHGKKNVKAANQSDIKLLLQFSLLMVVFTITSIVFHVEAQFGREGGSKAMGYFGNIGYGAMSGINPLVYFTMSSVMRSACAKMLRAAKQSIGARLAAFDASTSNGGTNSTNGSGNGLISFHN